MEENLVKLAFSNPLYAISIRYEVTFEGNNQACLKVRGINLSKRQIMDSHSSFDRSNVATVAVATIPLLTLGMDPPINQLGMEFPIYPVLLSPHEMTMTQYESYCLEAVPTILQMVQDHLDLTPQQMIQQLTKRNPTRNTYRSGL